MFPEAVSTSSGLTAVVAQRAIDSDTNILHQISRRPPRIFLSAGGRARKFSTPHLSQFGFCTRHLFLYKVLVFEVKPMLRPIAFPMFLVSAVSSERLSPDLWSLSWWFPNCRGLTETAFVDGDRGCDPPTSWVGGVPRDPDVAYGFRMPSSNIWC